MGLHEASNIQYLSIGYGRIRRRCDKDDPKAVERKSKDGTPSYAIEYKDIDGMLVDITFRDDPEYGKSWTIHVEDSGQVYAIQVSEQSRTGSDLLKKIPNLRRGQFYKFKPYDHEKNRKRKTGISIECGGEKVQSYYQKFTGSETDGWSVENINGFPEYTGDWGDEDEVKIYFTRVTKFLRVRALEFLKSNGFSATRIEPAALAPPSERAVEHALDSLQEPPPRKGDLIDPDLPF